MLERLFAYLYYVFTGALMLTLATGEFTIDKFITISIGVVLITSAAQQVNHK